MSLLSFAFPDPPGVGNGSRDDQSDHLYEQYMYTRVTGLASPGNTNSSSGSSHSNNESNAHNPAAAWNQQQQQQQQQHQHKVTTGTLNRNKDQQQGPATKINNHLLRNNLLSSSVRDLLSTTLQHPNPQQHQQQHLFTDPNVIRSTNLDVNNTYAPLIERQNCKKVIRSNEFDKMNTLVQSQSGSRFILTSDYTPDSSTMIPPSTLIMRPGITTSRTVGSKIIRPDANAGFGPNAFESSRFGKSMRQHVSWKCTAVACITICIILFSCMIFIVSRPSPISSDTPHYNCPMSEDSSSATIPQPATCPFLCSGRGQYVKGSCTCNEGWKGRECNIRSDQCDSPDCSNHGSCIDGRCQCVPGFTGSNCDQEQCPLLCSGRGQYSEGSCVCSSGWKGKECELRKDQCDPVDCNRHGSCVEGDCVCKPGWKGPACDLSTSLCDVSDCNGRGSCRSGMCDCRPGFRGIHCEIEECIDPTCSGHGSCFEGRCICKPGWVEIVKEELRDIGVGSDGWQWTKTNQELVGCAWCNNRVLCGALGHAFGFGLQRL